VLLLLALARIGAIAVPVNPELNAKEAGYILRDAEEPDGLTPAHPVSDKELPAAQ
jgi:acyl-CoA synthetase (AMP-forming)/AMP-acid ligase II